MVAIPELLGAALIAIQQGTMPNGRDMAWLRERVVESWGAVLSAIEKELETDVR